MLLLAIIWLMNTTRGWLMHNHPTIWVAFLAQFPCKPLIRLGSCPAILAFCVVFTIWCCDGQSRISYLWSSNPLYCMPSNPSFLCCFHHMMTKIHCHSTIWAHFLPCFLASHWILASLLLTIYVVACNSLLLTIYVVACHHLAAQVSWIPHEDDY